MRTIPDQQANEQTNRSSDAEITPIETYAKLERALELCFRGKAIIVIC